MPLLPVNISDLKNTDRRALARAITMVENGMPGSDAFLESLDFLENTPVTGITGPPGAGKSTLLAAIIGQLTADGKKVAVLAVDPTSPFNHGSLLGDRIRMNAWFNHRDVFIRSVATRGSLGGLSAKIIEMTDVLRHAGFDHVFVETVGIGQSEVEIAGLADTTLLVLIPGTGDDIQHIKSGVMEIADAYVVNKADRADAAAYAAKLENLAGTQPDSVPVFRTIAETGEGVSALIGYLNNERSATESKKLQLYTEKAYSIIRERKMAGINKEMLRQALAEALLGEDFNLYQFTRQF